MEQQSRSSRDQVLSAREWILMAALAFTVALSCTTILDERAGSDLESLFQRALVTFALARTLNGVISAVQGTELALQPAGVGVTLTPGEVLDPVNDLVERFSWIMLGATISLGIQQVLLEIGQWWALKVTIVLLSLVFLGLRLWRKKHRAGPSTSLESILIYTLLTTLFLRFAVPLALVANEAVYTLFLESRYLESTLELESAETDLEKVSSSSAVDAGDKLEEVNDDRSLFARFFDSTSEKLDFDQKLKEVKKRTSELIEHMVQLCVVFILQTGVLPLLFLWVLLSSMKLVLRFRPN